MITRPSRASCTSHGRATPLIWMTVSKATLKNKRNDHEYRLIERLHECLSEDVKITLLADRGFGDQKLYRFLQTLGWDFVIRFRGAIQVEDAEGTRKSANAWVPESGRAMMIRGARVTRTKAEVPAVVVVHDRLMKTNTSKKRTMSLLNQGLNLYAAIPRMGEDRLAPLMKAFDEIVRQHEMFRAVFGLSTVVTKFCVDAARRIRS